MLNFYPDAPQFSLKDSLEPDLSEYFNEVREYLPNLPPTINIWLTDEFIIPESGSGGFAYATDIISIGFDPHFADKEIQRDNLKGIVFHESFHLIQGHTANDTKAKYTSLLDAAIYEGCATVFEREYTQSHPLWGLHADHSSQELAQWRDGMADIPYNGDHDTIADLYSIWAFYDQSDQQRWKLYKTGTWLVDQALSSSGQDITELQTMSASQILRLGRR